MTAKYALALEEARRSVDRQASDLARLRDRSVALLGVAGTLMSILGGLAIRDGQSITSWTWAAIIAFVVICALSVAIMWPRKVHFDHSAVSVIEATDVAGATTDRVMRHVAEQTDSQFEKNRGLITSLVNLYCATTVVFGIEVITLLLDLRGRS